MTNTRFEIACVPGDGIGTEIMAAGRRVLDAVADGFSLSFEEHEAGAALYRQHGIDVAPGTFEHAGRADAILLGAIGLPDVRYPDGTEISPHLRMRTEFGLYAGLRPVKTFPNAPGPLASPRAAEIDLVIVRESTEGLFASVGKGELIDDREARETLVITREVTERVSDAAFALARRRAARGGPGHVTCVDKANVFQAYAFFRKVFDERARLFPEIRTGHAYVDAMALDLVRRPWDFDVLVMENMFGDILSDLGAGIVGSMGLAPCGEIGDEHALFQPAHGSAPDIAGQNVANPTAMILSAAMMLDWLGDRHEVPAAMDAAGRIERAVEAGFALGEIRPREFGGDQSTDQIADAVVRLIETE